MGCGERFKETDLLRSVLSRPVYIRKIDLKNINRRKRRKRRLCTKTFEESVINMDLDLQYDGVYLSITRLA